MEEKVIFPSHISLFQVTRMLIKVDLQCSRCYKKIKKILCKFPQIRDQVYNKKQNMVLIAIVCCSSEKIRQKIICKGNVTVLSIEILLEKPEEPEKPKKPKVVIEPPTETPKPPAPKPVPTLPPKVPQPAPPKPPP